MSFVTPEPETLAIPLPARRQPRGGELSFLRILVNVAIWSSRLHPES